MSSLGSTWPFLSFSSFTVTLTVLKSMGHGIWRLSLHWDFSEDGVIRLGLWIPGRKRPGSGAFLSHHAEGGCRVPDFPLTAGVGLGP